MLNNVVLMGRLTADPELKQTQNGVSVLSFSLAVDRDYTQQGQEKQVDFINIVAWRLTAEFISKYFTKGQMMALKGAIQTRSYEDKQGNKRTAFEVVADKVYFCSSKTEGSNNGKSLKSDNVSVGFDDFDGFEEIGSNDDDSPF